LKLPNNYGLPKPLFVLSEEEKQSGPPELIQALQPVSTGKARDIKHDTAS
jgi:hypothetical protein